jgi:hypothetical protein
VDSRSCLDDVEKRQFLTLPGLERRPLCRPTVSQSLYRLRYPGYHTVSVINYNYFNVYWVKVVSYSWTALKIAQHRC